MDMSTLKRTLAALLLIPLLLACTPRAWTARTPTPPPTPRTVTPSAHFPAAPQASEPVLLPSATPTASATPLRPTLDPTYYVLPTLTPTPTPNAEKILIRLEVPGHMAKITSPFLVRAYMDPTILGVTNVELFGEDGRLLARKTTRTYPNQYNLPVYLPTTLDFEIRAAAEIGRVQVSAEDKGGNIIALTGVHVLLLSVGAADDTPAAILTERAALIEPVLGQQYTGGTVPVIGEMNPYNEKPVVLELTTLTGQVLGSRVLYFDPPDGSYQPFETTLNYTVREKTPARLIIRQADARIDGLIYLFSRQIELLP